MTKLMFALIGVVMFALPATILAGSNLRGVVSHASGTYIVMLPESLGGTCPESGCVGELLTCPAGEACVLATGVYSFFEGICDDGGSNPCAGRLTILQEDCNDPRLPPSLGGPGGRDIKLDGAILSIGFRGESIICFDDTATPEAPADCFGSSSTAAIIFEGDTQGQTRTVIGTLDQKNTVETTTTSSTKFTIDGTERRLPEERIYTTYVTVQPDPQADNCENINTAVLLLPPDLGCGFAATTVSTNRQ